MSNDERRALARGHVAFELDQLTSLVAAIERFERSGPPSVAIACFESFLLHARNLIDFLWQRIEASDVRIDHRCIADDVMTVMSAFVD